MKRERVEDLGIIYEKLRTLDYEIESTWGHRASSKHTIDEFINYYSDPEHLEDLHDHLRFLKDRLDEISYIAHGDLPDE